MDSDPATSTVWKMKGENCEDSFVCLEFQRGLWSAGKKVTNGRFCHFSHDATMWGTTLSNPAQDDTDSFWFAIAPPPTTHREFLLQTPNTTQRRWFTPTASATGQMSWLFKIQGWEIFPPRWSLFTTSNKQGDSSECFPPFRHQAPASSNPCQKTQKIVLWRNLSPSNKTVCGQNISSRARTSVSVQLTFHFLFRKSSLSCKWAAWASGEPSRLDTASFPSLTEKTCVILNVMCLYLPCRVTLPQLATAQRRGETFECLLRWQRVQTTHRQSRRKVGATSLNKSTNFRGV